MSRTYGVQLERSAPVRLSAHPEGRSGKSWREWAKAQDRPLAVDLFSGAGGLSLGLEAAGFRVILAADHDPWALETHRHNFPGISLHADLADAHRRDALVELLAGLDIALLVAGPPCQPFSRAGRYKIRDLIRKGARDQHDYRRDLWRAFLDIAERVHPRAVLMENVPDMALGDDCAVVRAIADRLEAAKYEVQYKLMDAWRHGVPQHRQRLILVATDGESGSFVWPKEADAPTLRDAIGDLPRLRATTGASEAPYRAPKTRFQRRARELCKGPKRHIVYDHVTRPVRADDRRAFTLMTSSTRYGDLPKRLQRYRADIFDDKYKRLGWNELSRSITAHIAKDGYWYIHPSEQRTLSVREAARIQTFPDHFRFAGSRSHQFAQIGNAVPPALAEAVGAALLTALHAPSDAPTLRESAWRDRLRADLDEWGDRDRRRHRWRYSDDPWKVLVGLALEGRVGGGWPDANSFLSVFPSPSEVTTREVRRVISKAEPRTRETAVRRLVAVARLVKRDPRAWDSKQWVTAGHATPGERAWMRTLAFDDLAMTPSVATLRVVARLTATGVDQQRQRSDGRVALAQLLGCGPRASKRNAALHWIGTTICGPEPSCADCPLAEDCRTQNATQ